MHTICSLTLALANTCNTSSEIKRLNPIGLEKYDGFAKEAIRPFRHICLRSAFRVCVCVYRLHGSADAVFVGRVPPGDYSYSHVIMPETIAF